MHDHDRPPQPRSKLVEPSPWLRSQDLFGQSDQVVLIHEGQYYRLRKTRSGKLLLNK